MQRHAENRLTVPQRGDPPRSAPSDDGAPAVPIDVENGGGRLSSRELRRLAARLQHLARCYAPADAPSIDELVTEEAFAASQCAGYRIAEDPFRALLAMSRAVTRSADHRETAEGRGVSHG